MKTKSPIKTDHPIIFNPEMVKAIIDGRKTQTRRPVVWSQKSVEAEGCLIYDNWPYNCHGGNEKPLKCPFGKAGHTLWVRETFNHFFAGETIGACKFIADAGTDRWMQATSVEQARAHWSNWTPSIHMPRWASRIDLKVKRVWLEKVNLITLEDAFAEGVGFIPDGDYTHSGVYRDYMHKNPDWHGFSNAKSSFESLWNSIYGNWKDNPYVWACEFEIMKIKTT